MIFEKYLLPFLKIINLLGNFIIASDTFVLKNFSH